MNRLLLPNVRIRLKLFVLLLTLVVVPFAVYATIILGQVSAELETLGFHSAEQGLHQAASFVESRTDLVKRALDLMTLNPQLRELAVTDPQAYSVDPGLWIRDAGVLHQIEDTAGQNNPDLRGFVLYMSRGIGASLSRQESTQFLSLDDQGNEAWLKELDPGENLPQWFAPEVAFDRGVSGDIRALRRIPDDQDLPSTVGWARADLKPRALEEILDQAPFSTGSAAFLIDGRGRAVARSKQAQAWSADVLRSLASGDPGTWVDRSVEGHRTWANRRAVRSTGWSLVIAVPDEAIGAFGDRTRGWLLLVLAVLVPLMVPLSLWAASSSTRRLDLLLSGVRQLGAGQLDIRLPASGRDEIGELTDNFNRMVDQMRQLMDDRYRLGAEVKHRELEALQAQINPHFLYNTLDLISGLAQLARQPRIVETVSALSRFYRLALSGGQEEIALGQEFDHASSYVAIQNLRFEGAVDLSLDLEPALADRPIIKMLLQPLVENALLHGILEKPEEKGRIAVRARQAEGFLLLEVEDDGVGLPGGADPGTGYGVQNIRRRLGLRYGDAAGLRYRRGDLGGTLAEIRIPLAALPPLAS